MAQKERIKEIRIVLGYFIKNNYPIQNALLIFEDEDNISDQRQRIYDNLMSDESLLIDEINISTKEVKSQRCPSSPRRKHKLNQSMDFGELDKLSESDQTRAVPRGPKPVPAPSAPPFPKSGPSPRSRRRP